MNSQMAFYILIAVLVGGLGGIHIPMNGALGARIDSALVATFVLFGIAFLLIAVTVLLTFDRQAFLALRTVPAWFYLAGVISVVVVGSNTFLIPRVGDMNMFALVIASQMMVRMVISHYGWFELPVSPITWPRAVGALFLVGGAVLVVRN